MYDIELFKNIFAEGEILVMSDEFILSLKKLLDDKMSVRVLKFFENVDNSEIPHSDHPVAQSLMRQVNRMKELLMETIKLNTFHLEVQKRNLFDFVRQLNYETALSVIQDRKKAMEDLEWLLSNRNYWKSWIDERKREDYTEFVNHCLLLKSSYIALSHQFRDAGLDIELKSYGNIMERIKGNKEFFYSPTERRRTTQMSTVMYQANTLEIVLHGLQYQQLCDKQEIQVYARRHFVPQTRRKGRV